MRREDDLLQGELSFRNAQLAESEPRCGWTQLPEHLESYYKSWETNLNAKQTLEVVSSKVKALEDRVRAPSRGKGLPPSLTAPLVPPPINRGHENDASKRPSTSTAARAQPSNYVASLPRILAPQIGRAHV